MIKTKKKNRIEYVYRGFEKHIALIEHDVKHILEYPQHRLPCGEYVLKVYVTDKDVKVNILVDSKSD